MASLLVLISRSVSVSSLSAATNIDTDKCRRKLFVGQLPNFVSEHQLRLLFSKFGRVIQLKIRQDHEHNMRE